MATKVFRESFDGKYDGVSPKILLAKGSVSGGKNMRKVGDSGGWKVRKGSVLHNTTQISDHSIKSLHLFKHPRNADYHFLAQINSLLYDSINDPPASGAGFGTSLGITVGLTPGISDIVGDKWIYADGSSLPIIWQGDKGSSLGFFSYGHTEKVYNDYSRNVKDKKIETKAVILGGANDKAYLITHERCKGYTADLGAAVNTSGGTLIIKAWRSGVWTAVSGLSDGTANWAHDGTVTWTASSLDKMRIVSGVMGYAYELSWSGALSNAIDLLELTTKENISTLTNKWNGAFDWLTGCFFYSSTLDSYKDVLGTVSNESTSDYFQLSPAHNDNLLYMKTPEPAAAFGIGVSYANTLASVIDQLDYWDGSAWTAVSNLVDGTKVGANCFAQSGTVSFDASDIEPQKRILEGDEFPGYWYRLGCNNHPYWRTSIFIITYGIFPTALSDCAGVVSFKNRLLTWGDPEFPNKLRYSTTNFFDCFCGSDSDWTQAFGDMSKILYACTFYNELLVFKESSIWLLEGFDKSTFYPLKITDTVGLASIASVQTIEIGYKGMGKNEAPVTITIWQAIDGVYVFDGRKTRKVSIPIDNYFNPESSDCIAGDKITGLSSFVDKANNEYHLLLPTKELIYNYVSDEWYPSWEREIDLTCGICLKGTDNRNYTYGGSSNGRVFKLEQGTVDKNNSNENIAIEHSLMTRAFSIEEKDGISTRFNFRKLWAKLKARSSGTVTVKTFKNLTSNGISQSTPKPMSMISSDEGISIPALEMSLQNCNTLSIEFKSNIINIEMEIWGFIYELEIRGLPNQ